MDYKQVRVTLTPEAVTALDALIEDCNSKIPFWHKKTNRAGMASATIISMADVVTAREATRVALESVLARPINDASQLAEAWQDVLDRASKVRDYIEMGDEAQAELKVLQKEIIREVFLKWRTGTASVRFHEDEWLASKEYEQVSQRFGAELVAEVVK